MSLLGNFTMTLQRIFKNILPVCLLLLWDVPGLADVCVWRDPDRTMSKLFPEASDYRTVTKKMTPEIVAAIEKKLGTKLEDSEMIEFNFYELLSVKNGRPNPVGIAMALAGAGEYGAIEVVIGVDRESIIRAVYIQRSREKANSALRSEAFLKQFAGKSAEDSLEFGKDLMSLEEAPKAAEAVRLVIKKMLVFQRELADVFSAGDDK